MNHIKPCGTLMRTDIKLRGTESVSQKRNSEHTNMWYIIRVTRKGGGESMREEIDPGFN